MSKRIFIPQLKCHVIVADNADESAILAKYAESHTIKSARRKYVNRSEEQYRHRHRHDDVPEHFGKSKDHSTWQP